MARLVPPAHVALLLFAASAAGTHALRMPKEDFDKELSVNDKLSPDVQKAIKAYDSATWSQLHQFECPADLSQDEMKSSGLAPHYFEKYAKQCEDRDVGMWYTKHGKETNAKFDWVARAFQLQHGAHTVYDFGAGCGHQSMHLKETLPNPNLTIVACDLAVPAVQWGRRQTGPKPDHFCATDCMGDAMMSKLQGKVDLVVSNGVLVNGYGHPGADDGRSIYGAIEKLMVLTPPGGCQWHGCLAGFETDKLGKPLKAIREDVIHNMTQHFPAPEYVLDVSLEQELFGQAEYGDDTLSLWVCRK